MEKKKKHFTQTISDEEKRVAGTEREEESVTFVENLLYARPSGAVHLMGNLAPAWAV